MKLARACRLAALVVVGCAATAGAQFRPGHIGGIVKNEDGQPIRGAVIVAQNKDATPPTLNAVSDDKGRFGLLGLRSGLWSLLVRAPGFEPTVLAWPVRRESGGPPVEVRLVAIPGGAAVTVFDKLKAGSVVQDLEKASTLLDQGRADDALVLYRALLDKAPSLTSLHLAMARAYRVKKDAPHAIAAYRTLLSLQPDHSVESKTVDAASSVAAAPGTAEPRTGSAPSGGKENSADRGPDRSKVRLELALTLDESGDRIAAVRELERVIADAPTSPTAATAREKLRSLRP